MTLNDLMTIDGFELLQKAFEDQPIRGAYTSDLLSDVVANAKEGSVLITIQAHHNTVAVASLTGITGIIVCNNRAVTDDMLASAKNERIGLFRTARNQFETSCLIGSHLDT